MILAVTGKLEDKTEDGANTAMREEDTTFVSRPSSRGGF